VTLGKRSGEAHAIAERVHAAALRLLRRLRKSDIAMGVSPAKASALSVLVFGGAQTLKDLAAAEQVRAPTMSRLVAELEAAGLATKTADAGDRRALKIAATAKGKALLEAGRERRLAVLAKQVAGLSAAEQTLLKRAAALLGRLNEG
jgi:DNA-binding MarR family transcriptional regulator